MRLNAGVVGKCHCKYRREEGGGVSTGSNNLLLTRHRKQSNQDSDYSHFYTQCFVHVGRFFCLLHLRVVERSRLSLGFKAPQKKKKKNTSPFVEELPVFGPDIPFRKAGI